VKKKKFILLPLLSLFLSSCLFDSDDEGLSNWLSDQGMPSSYKVQTVTINDLKPISAEVFRDTLPENARYRGVFGATPGMTHDVYFDFRIDSTFMATLNNADTIKSVLYMRLLDAFYNTDHFLSNLLPIEEDIKIDVSWILSDKLSKKEYEDLENIKDSVWFHELESWNPQKSADTILTFSLKAASKGDSLENPLLTIDMPGAFVKEFRNKPGYRRLQMRLSAPEAENAYRFYGSDHINYYPQFHLVAVKKDSMENPSHRPVRSALLASYRENCKDCLVLHGGYYDSLVVEFPSKPILKALSEFYGDEFPYMVGDKNDVRQAVVMAEMTFSRDDSKGENELDLPIVVLASSYADSADTVVHRMEKYKVNRPRVQESGHPNMIFYSGDSLSLQVTKGMRDFINRASDGRSFKMALRMDQSVLLPKDSIFVDRYDSINVFYPTDYDYARYDMARYDFTSIKDKPATLKLWLASKRGEK
jgi:hypothetical protein